jgi:hypothetical protein
MVLESNGYGVRWQRLWCYRGTVMELKLAVMLYQKGSRDSVGATSV